MLQSESFGRAFDRIELLDTHFHSTFTHATIFRRTSNFTSKNVVIREYSLIVAKKAVVIKIQIDADTYPCTSPKMTLPVWYTFRLAKAPCRSNYVSCSVWINGYFRKSTISLTDRQRTNDKTSKHHPIITSKVVHSGAIHYLPTNDKNWRSP